MSDFLQGSLNIVAYYTKIKRLWDELDTLNTKSVCSCTCYCGGKEKIVKAQQDERAIHFLMGLSEAYVVVRSTILMISPLPSIILAYSLLVQDEKQREIFVSFYPTGNHSSYLMPDGNGPSQYPGHGNRSKHLNTRLRRVIHH